MKRRGRGLQGIAERDFEPMRVLEIELGEPLPEIEAEVGEPKHRYAEALCLVRLHGSPIGMVELPIPGPGLAPDQLAKVLTDRLGPEIEEHLRADGLVWEGLDRDGLPSSTAPRCRGEREEFLRRAPRISVVIPTRNRPASALRTARSVLACRYPSDRLEVIVVDNGSGEDERVQLPTAEQEGDSALRLLSEPAPGGSNARNAGLAAATGEIVAFCDDDVLVDRDWLLAIAVGFDRSDRVGVVAGLSMPLELETLAQGWFEGFSTAQRGFGQRIFDRRNPPADRPLFPFTVGDLGTGQNFAFRRQVLTELGGFDPALGTATPALGGEDVEATLRVLLADREVVYEPNAIVWHSHPREFEQFERRVWGYGVGLTASLTKVLFEHPRLVPQLLRKLPAGIAYAVSPSSGKNESKPREYPKRLAVLELRGMVYGPLAYARSRRLRRSAGAHGLEGRRGRKKKAAALPSTAAGAKILIVTDSYWPLIGGANRSTELLAQALARGGSEVVVCTSWQEGVPAVEDQGEVRIHRIRDLTSRVRWISEDPYKHNPPPFPDPEAVLRLRRLLADFEPDIVHSYGWLTHSVAVALLGKDIPLLLSARGYGNICAVNNLDRYEAICDGPAPLKCLACSADTYGAAKGTAAVFGVFGAGPVLRRKVSTIHSVSRFVAGKMDRFLRVPGARDVVIPNFHEDSSGQPVDEELMALLPEEPFILYVGAFRRIKGIEELFDAYGRLENPPPLVLVGTRAPDTPSEFPAGAVVIEDVPNPTVMAFWERALFGVFPTRIPEALGNVVHEAMSKGRAVIGTTPGGHADMIEDGESGLLVPAGDAAALAEAMALLASDADLRRRMGAAALERSKDFTPEVVMPRLERLYAETIADHGRTER
jgi:glycosyltransferase involved in cell wall biosynthesis/GT2 family glycosyltransferase